MNVLIATSLDFYSCVRPGLRLPQWLEVQVELHVGELLQHRKRHSFRAQPPVCITFGSMYHPSTGHEIVLISLPPFSLQFTAPGIVALSIGMLLMPPFCGDSLHFHPLPQSTGTMNSLRSQNICCHKVLRKIQSLHQMVCVLRSHRKWSKRNRNMPMFWYWFTGVRSIKLEWGRKKKKKIQLEIIHQVSLFSWDPAKLRRVKASVHQY